MDRGLFIELLKDFWAISVIGIIIAIICPYLAALGGLVIGYGIVYFLSHYKI